ncbi:unnamed protein product [Miscanthus lutarioriparius]|uniref:Uncharacterized protein n=1 Tax=Miscanthus lutarioriparius TaxID=422564 RepID=A0A811R711_9POAL|nr:unnamed protein product [Miscanthus lutarioriparius]
MAVGATPPAAAAPHAAGAAHPAAAPPAGLSGSLPSPRPRLPQLTLVWMCEKKARFWRDVWMGQCPLSIVSNRIFSICNEQENTVHEVFQNNGINLTFRRSFGIEEAEEWQQLVLQVRDFQLQEGADTVIWALEKNEVEYPIQGEGNKLDFEDSGKAIKTFGAKRPRLVV